MTPDPDQPQPDPAGRPVRPVPEAPPPRPAPRVPPPDAIELAPGVRAAESGLRFQFARSSGPGGQNVNKVNTKAEVWVRVDDLYGLSFRALGRLKALAGRRLTDAGEIHIASDEERSQQANREAVLRRLRELLVAALHEPKPRRKTKPSKAAKARRLDAKRRRSEVKSRRRGAPHD